MIYSRVKTGHTAATNACLRPLIAAIICGSALAENHPDVAKRLTQYIQPF